MTQINLTTLTAGVLPLDFYEQPTLTVAKELLGKTLVSLAPNQEEATAGIIVETEGYIAPEDPACHAYAGRTKRNEVMWGPAGRAYVYFTYGNHWMINTITESEGIAAGVLIRAVQPILGSQIMETRRNLKVGVDKRNLTNGPGKLCQAMGVSGLHNGEWLQGSQLLIVDTPSEVALPKFDMVETTRIGITRGVDLPWRYYVDKNRYVSVLAKKSNLVES